MDNTAGSLSQIQRSVIIGSLLGDGYLRIVPGRRNAFLEVNHSFKQKDYVDWKYSILKDITVSAPRKRVIDKVRTAYRFYTKQHPEITELFKEFYKDGVKIIPKDLKISTLSLAVWLMDDGSKCRKIDVYLNTQQFSHRDQLTLINVLNELNLSARLNKDKTYTRIRFMKKSLLELKRLISPHIIPSMKYKIEI